MARTYRCSLRVSSLPKEVYAERRAKNWLHCNRWHFIKDAQESFDEDVAWNKKWFDRNTRDGLSETSRSSGLKHYSKRACRSYYRNVLTKAKFDDDFDVVVRHENHFFQDRWTWW